MARIFIYDRYRGSANNAGRLADNADPNTSWVPVDQDAAAVVDAGLLSATRSAGTWTATNGDYIAFVIAGVKYVRKITAGAGTAVVSWAGGTANNITGVGNVPAGAVTDTRIGGASVDLDGEVIQASGVFSSGVFTGTDEIHFIGEYSGLAMPGRAWTLPKFIGTAFAKLEFTSGTAITTLTTLMSFSNMQIHGPSGSVFSSKAGTTLNMTLLNCDIKNINFLSDTTASVIDASFSKSSVVGMSKKFLLHNGTIDRCLFEWPTLISADCIKDAVGTSSAIVSNTILIRGGAGSANFVIFSSNAGIAEHNNLIFDQSANQISIKGTTYTGAVSAGAGQGSQLNDYYGDPLLIDLANRLTGLRFDSPALTISDTGGSVGPNGAGFFVTDFVDTAVSPADPKAIDLIATAVLVGGRVDYSVAGDGFEYPAQVRGATASPIAVAWPGASGAWSIVKDTSDSTWWFDLGAKHSMDAVQFGNIVSSDATVFLDNVDGTAPNRQTVLVTAQDSLGGVRTSVQVDIGTNDGNGATESGRYIRIKSVATAI